MMKKFFLLLALFCGVAFAAQSQDFKPFRVDLGLGYGLPFERSMDGGLLFYVEPKYEVAKQISVGLRWDNSLFVGIRDNGNTGSAKLSSAYLLTGDFHLNNNTFRPFVGLGVGLYENAGASVTMESDEVVNDELKNTFGGLLRAGFDVSHFRFTASYNYAGKNGNEAHHYLGLTVGFYIGGGKRK